MILCLDIGNSHIHGGVYENTSSEGKLVFQFRKTSNGVITSDEFGVFLKSVIRENGLTPEEIQRFALCSVVPELVYSVQSAFKKYFGHIAFVLEPGVKTGLRIKYKNPLEVGADRIANAVAATTLFPDKNTIVVDFGTATTLCAITQDKDYLGGIIVAGLKLCMTALDEKTAKLPRVEITKPSKVLGDSTVSSIQSGLYFGHLEMVSGLVKKIMGELNWHPKTTTILATGGLSSLFKEQDLFQLVLPDLCLRGIQIAYRMNKEKPNAT